MASLAIDKWDDKVLDPACGSGTLLAEAYQAKLRKAKEQGINIPEDRLHEIFLREHIVGIDVMQFAKELTTINLALQNPFIKVEPRVFAGDGIEKMVHAEKVIGDDPSSENIERYLRESQEEYMKLALLHEGFDVVIMNPPFTRWEERIPEREKGKLMRMLGNIISGGRIGYWAFFFVASDNVIRPGGKIAAVTPEEFFSGRTAISVREYLLGKRGYALRYVVRSAVETAFSEGAHYRDYLVVLEKGGDPARDYLVFIILKRRIEELTDGDIMRLMNDIRTLDQGGHHRSISGDFFDVVIIHDVSRLITRFVDNLKPIVGFNSPNAQKLFLELLDTIGSFPKLSDVAEIITYWPGKYRGHGEGVEDYARRLFIARYGARGKISFRLVNEDRDRVVIKLGNTDVKRSIDKKYLVPSLRTASNVRHFDITGESEFALVDEHALEDDDWKAAGLNDGRRRRSAIYDVREATEIRQAGL
ncbi:SAM-dependent methyltransferase [Vulcanisaeta sp. JCM 16159]|uniref:SAM-dependent methyltransferase n=1 Tax=Vulcanisaeta sp. JCM 16159 TaxID=1295371 RepID=UPI0006CF2BB1|nr:SAM-dependent methyltransferase [Vulcanisaeta sp. JCM 16159]